MKPTDAGDNGWKRKTRLAFSNASWAATLMLAHHCLLRHWRLGAFLLRTWLQGSHSAGLGSTSTSAQTPLPLDGIPSWHEAPNLLLGTYRMSRGVSWCCRTDWGGIRIDKRGKRTSDRCVMIQITKNQSYSGQLTPLTHWPLRP